MITRRGLIKAGLLGAGMVSHGTAFAAEAIESASGMTAHVGAQTFAGVEILTLRDDTDSALTGVAVTGGTATGTAYNLSVTGVLTVANDGSMTGEHGNTITYTSDQGGGTVTLDVDDSRDLNMTVNNYAELLQTYSAVATGSEYLAAITAQTILRDGTYAPSATYFKNRPFTNPWLLKSQNRGGARFSTFVDINNSQNFHFEGIFFESYVTMRAGSSGIVLRDTIHEGTYINPDGDFTSTAGPSSTAIRGSGVNSVGDLLVENAEIYGWGDGISVGSPTGPITIIGNHIYNIYSDCVQIGGYHTLVVSQNVLESPIAKSTHLGNPHADFFQHLGSSAQDVADVTFDMNILFCNHAEAAPQGIFMDDMGVGLYFSGVKVRGNVVVNIGGGTTGIRIMQAENCEIVGNTVVSWLGRAGQGPGILIGEVRTSGTHTVQNNATDFLSVAGPQTNVDNNVVLGRGGATIPYTTAFDGSGFDPADRAEVLSMFAMRAAGPLDQTDNMGAIGSGYVTFPTSTPGRSGVLNSL